MRRLTISNSNNGWTMDARNMNNIIYPLLCLMPSLLKILPHIANRSELNLSAADGEWLKDEFQQLLKSAHLAGARGEAEVECEHSCYSSNETTAFGVKRKCKADDETRDSVIMTRKRRYNHSAIFRLCSTRGVKRIARRYATPVGMLVIETELPATRPFCNSRGLLNGSVVGEAAPFPKTSNIFHLVRGYAQSFYVTSGFQTSNDSRSQRIYSY